MGTLNRFSVEFLVRTGCHLCDDMAPIVRQATRCSMATVRTVDIDSDDHLVREYGLQIPVVLLKGEVIAEGTFKARTLWGRIMRRRLFG